jgi:excisionase family DNA binding protein
MIPALPDPPAAYTVQQVATRLQIDDDAVRALIRSGELRAFNVGLGKAKPRYRITSEALADFERKRTVGPPPARPRRRRRRAADVIPFF